MERFHDNPWYDFVFVYVGTKPIPSTRTPWKKLIWRLRLQSRESMGIMSFRNSVQEGLRGYPQLKVPLKGRVLVSLAIKLTPIEYEKRDIDNMVKSLLDALVGIAYENDKQVAVLHVVKLKSDDNRWHIGLKALAENESAWYFPPLYEESPTG